MSPRRRAKKEFHAPHIDEKWLVSYSDMMTLLFGFFVLMFTIASQHKGDVSNSLQEISDQMNDKKRNTQVQTKIEIDKTEYENIKLKQFENDSLKARFVGMSTMMEELQTKLTELQKKNMDLAPKPPATLEEVQAMKEQIRKLTSQSEKDQLHIEKLNAQLKEDLNQIKKLEEKLGESGKKNFIMTFIQWNTEKHDVDMIIKDPNGKMFDFRKRKYEKYPGEFVLDSRYGPGAEVWNSQNFIPGIYTMTITLYNQYGNLNDAVVNGSILSGQGRINIPELHLNLSKMSSKTLRFNVSPEGKINFLD